MWPSLVLTQSESPCIGSPTFPTLQCLELIETHSSIMHPHHINFSNSIAVASTRASAGIENN
jgi:hypothetical protein